MNSRRDTLGFCIITSSSDLQPTEEAAFLSLVPVSLDPHIALNPCWGFGTVVSLGFNSAPGVRQTAHMGT